MHLRDCAGPLQRKTRSISFFCETGIGLRVRRPCKEGGREGRREGGLGLNASARLCGATSEEDALNLLFLGNWNRITSETPM